MSVRKLVAIIAVVLVSFCAGEILRAGPAEQVEAAKAKKREADEQAVKEKNAKRPTATTFNESIDIIPAELMPKAGEPWTRQHESEINHWINRNISTIPVRLTYPRAKAAVLRGPNGPVCGSRYDAMQNVYKGQTFQVNTSTEWPADKLTEVEKIAQGDPITVEGSASISLIVMGRTQPDRTRVYSPVFLIFFKDAAFSAGKK